jgi:4-hydroxy-tetrahydrodipicolinate reductase
MLRVGVFGAAGRMGQAVCAAVGSDPELELVAMVDPAFDGSTGPFRSAWPEVMAEAGAVVAVDFTVPGAALPNARWCAENGVHDVIGTTGFGEAALSEMERLFAAGPANCVVAPNFAIGAVLMMRFSELAAPWFETAEIIELHHEAKVDAPSGTARMTAKRIAAARRRAAAHHELPTEGARQGADPPGSAPARGEITDGVPVHSVRLRGLVAHQEVLLGTSGQVLTIRHDSLDRASFIPGVLLAVKQVASRRGLTVGLDAFLGF